MGDRQWHRAISETIRGAVIDAEISEEQREKVAKLARRLADTIKRFDPAFCYEWFYGACGLDHWGELMGR